MIRTKLRFPSMLRASLGYSDQTSTFASEISRSGAALNMMAGWGDSDARPPNRLYSQVDTSLVYGGPGETRTHNLQLRRLTRYPLRYGSKFVRRPDHSAFYPLWMAGASAHSRSAGRVTVQPFARDRMSFASFSISSVFFSRARESTWAESVFSTSVFNSLANWKRRSTFFLMSFWLASRIAFVSILGELGSSSLSFKGGRRGGGAWAANMRARMPNGTPSAQRAITNLRLEFLMETLGSAPSLAGARQQVVEPLPMLYSLFRKEYAEPLHALV